MKYIPLTGKYAMGDHAHAIVDDDMLEELSRYKWKAKPNADGNNIYAVRNTTVNGKNRTIRMHHVVMGIEYDGIHDTDHKNGNSLDNRRENLIRTTRSGNIKKQKRTIVEGACSSCGASFRREVTAGAAHNISLCKDGCQAPHVPIAYTKQCEQCGITYKTNRRWSRYHNDRCRYTAKNRRDKQE